MKTSIFRIIGVVAVCACAFVALVQQTPTITNTAPAPSVSTAQDEPPDQSGSVSPPSSSAPPAIPVPPPPPVFGQSSTNRIELLRSLATNRAARTAPGRSVAAGAGTTNVVVPRTTGEPGVSVVPTTGPGATTVPATPAAAAAPTGQPPLVTGQPTAGTARPAPSPAAIAGAVQPGQTNLVVTTPGTNAITLTQGGKIMEHVINLQVSPIDQVLNLYALLTGRSILRPTSLPAASITFRNEQELTLEEAIQALDAVLALNGITMINVGDKFVSAVPSQQALQEGAAFSGVDPKELPEAGQFVTKVVTLKHALPSEVAQLLTGFAKMPNGVVPIDSTMTLVLRDYPANIKRMTEILERVDVEVESEYKLEVIPIKYGKVEDVYSTMSSLISGGAGGVVGAAGAGAAQTGVTGVRRTGTTVRGAAGRIGTRSVTPYGTGSGGYGTYRQPGVYTPQAAATTPVGGGTTTFSQRLQQIVSRMGTQPGEVQLLKDARIVPDQRSNSLIVYATKEDMAMITNILDKVDRLMAQVLIEAIIMDVELNDNYSLGVSALLNQQKTGDLDWMAANNGGAGLLSSFTNLTGSLPDGFNYWGQVKGDLSIAVKAIASSSRGHVLATPRVQTSHAMTASFDVSEQIPYVGSYPGYSGIYGYNYAMVQFADVSTILNVTPYITPDGLVVMEIDQTISEVTGFTEMPNAGKAPNTTSRSTSTTVSVRSGDTVILGGYIRTQKSRSRSGIPLLKDIPVMGALFGSTSRDTKRSELVVMLRPIVLASPEEAARLADEETQRLPGVREMQKEMREDEARRQQKADRTTGTKTTRQPTKQPKRR